MKANELQDALTQFLARESVQQMLVIIVIIMEVCVGFSGAQKVVCNPAEEVRADFWDKMLLQLSVKESTGGSWADKGILGRKNTCWNSWGKNRLY